MSRTPIATLDRKVAFARLRDKVRRATVEYDEPLADPGLSFARLETAIMVDTHPATVNYPEVVFYPTRASASLPSDFTVDMITAFEGELLPC